MGRCADCCGFLMTNKYAVYVLTVLMSIYLVNQLDTFCLIASNPEMSQEIGYGDRECASLNDTLIPEETCTDNTTLCDLNEYGFSYCYWKYLGRGLQYQLLAGPLYIVLFAISGIPMGLLSELQNLNRKVFLSVCAITWSLMTLLGGFCNEYWQLALTRSLVGIFSAACYPFSASLIADYFVKETRGAAMGFFNFGIFIGYSLTYVLLIAVDNHGWRSVYYIAGTPGLVLGLLCLVTVREPKQGATEEKPMKALDHLSGTCSKLGAASKLFIHPVLLLLSLGGAIRNGAGIAWAYNTVIFFNEYHPDIRVEMFMSWIPLVFGSASSFGGGYISDKLVLKRGMTGRLLFMITCTVISGCFNVGMLLVPNGYVAFGLHSIAYLFGEVWLSICIACVLDLVPSDLTASSVAVYFFFIQIIGGNMNLLVPPLTSVLSTRAALIIMFPGMYWFSCVFFGLAICVHAATRGNSFDLDEAVKDELDVDGEIGGALDRNSADLTGAIWHHEYDTQGFSSSGQAATDTEKVNQY